MADKSDVTRCCANNVLHVGSVDYFSIELIMRDQWRAEALFYELD